VHATEQGFAVGMHAALQINPYYGKTSRRGLLNHFRAVLDEGPGILYNVPARTGQDIPDDVVHDLASHANFLGIKECTGNQRIEARARRRRPCSPPAPCPPAHGQDLTGPCARQAYAGHGIRCWTGNDDEAHAARHSHDAQGVISVTSNIIPSLFVRLMRQQNDALADSVRELVDWLFCEPNPIPVNTALVRRLSASGASARAPARNAAWPCRRPRADALGVRAGDVRPHPASVPAAIRAAQPGAARAGRGAAAGGRSRPARGVGRQGVGGQRL
jgi:dihydrodipicolinate synthase/N-acetylneuraminate lyase